MRDIDVELVILLDSIDPKPALQALIHLDLLPTII